MLTKRNSFSGFICIESCNRSRSFSW